jgi:hypothetical protein
VLTDLGTRPAAVHAAHAADDHRRDRLSRRPDRRPDRRPVRLQLKVIGAYVASVSRLAAAAHARPPLSCRIGGVPGVMIRCADLADVRMPRV